jgi:hypothetical protein
MYKLLKNKDGSIDETGIIRVADKAWIPFDKANTDYRAYLAWLDEGNIPEPAEE